MKRNFWRSMWHSLGKMPEPAYIFLCAVFNITLIMLFSGFVMLLLYLDGGQADIRLFNLAYALIRDPAGVLLAGTMGFAIILDATI